MAKKVIIFKIGEGSFDIGFPFSLRLSHDETRELLVETEGKLPLLLIYTKVILTGNVVIVI